VGLGNVEGVTWPDAEVLVDEVLMREILAKQFPELANLPIRHIGEGFDNFLFQLGDDLVARMPRRARGVEPIENELRWLAVAAQHVTLATPLPLVAGKPGPNYAWPWMIGSLIEGVAGDEVDDETLFGSSRALGTFTRELHVTAPDNAPKNPWRSIPLAQRSNDLETRLLDLRSDVDAPRVWSHFERARAARPWSDPATWLHGDLHPGNLIFRDGVLVGVVDFGDLCAGDPATDLAGALLTLPYDALETFFATYGVDDEATLARTIGWAVIFGTLMVGLGRVSRPRYMKVGQRALENAARLSETPASW
jgi:aminoglycoside phosphotransferase (APT) family kinase protein